MHVEQTDPDWVVWLVNEFGSVPRQTAGESASPYPAAGSRPDAPGVVDGLADGDLADVADRLFDIFEASSVEQQVDELDRLLTVAAPRPRVVLRDKQCALGWDADSPTAALIAGCVLALLDLFADSGGAPRQLGLCSAARCQDVFVDRSPTRTRCYCSTECQTRTKVAAFRRRQRACRP